MSGNRYYERARAFERSILDRIVEEKVPFKWGTALFTPSVPAVRAFNLLSVETLRKPTAEQLHAEAERLQGGAGLRHRRVTFEHDELGRALVPGFEALGWKIDRFVLMGYRGGYPEAPGVRVTELDSAGYRRVHRKVIAEESPGMAANVVEQLVQMEAMLARATTARYFGTSWRRTVTSVCQMYSDGRTAQIEDVATLERWRGKGHARALMHHVLAYALDAGHDFVFLVADADDWPKDFYERLGFEALGRFHEFVIPGDP